MRVFCATNSAFLFHFLMERKGMRVFLCDEFRLAVTVNFPDWGLALTPFRIHGTSCTGNATTPPVSRLSHLETFP